jgi:hypothetical protein
MIHKIMTIITILLSVAIVGRISYGLLCWSFCS